jgi:hypothetical protein
MLLHPDNGHHGLGRLAFRKRIHKTFGYPKNVDAPALSELQNALAVVLHERRSGNDQGDRVNVPERLLDDLDPFDQEELFFFPVFRVSEGPEMFYDAVVPA